MPYRSLFAAIMLLLSAGAIAVSEPQQVTLQLKWHHQFQFAGYYVALEQGYYREEGLEVTIREGSPDLDPVTEVLSGRANFGIGASELVLERAAGKSVVALAVILQHSPLVLLAKSGPRVSTLQSLEGKEIRVIPHERELNALFLSKGYSQNDFHLVTRTTHDIEDLVAGRIAAISAYSTDEPYILDRFDIEYMVISPRSSGIDFYGDTLFTREEMVTDSADAVRAFRNASLKGWKYALEHPRETAELIIQRYAPDRDLEHLLLEARQMQILMLPDIIEVGYMNEERWRHIAERYADLGMIRHNVPLGEFIYDPNPQRDLTWFYLTTIAGFAAAILIGSIALYVYRINYRLRNSEQSYRKLIDTSPFPVIITSASNNTITYINHYAEVSFGIVSEDVLGHKAPNFWADPALREKMMAVLLRDGYVHDFEAEFKTGEGRHFWGYISASFIQYNGAPSLLISFNDISERKQMEVALRASEQRYRLLAENALDVIWTFNVASRKFTYVSPSVERMRGFTVEEVMQQTLDDALVPDSAKLAKEGLRHLIETGEILDRKWELEQPCKDGSTIWTDVILTLIRDETGKPVEVMGISRDVTEQHHLREALTTRLVAIEAAAESFMITDKDGNIEYVNPAFTQMTGYSLEEAVGKKPNIVKSGLHPQEFYQDLWETILAGNIWRGEITNRNRFGHIYTESQAIAPVLNDNGAIIHFVAVKHDVTQRKELEVRLEQMAHFDMLTGVPNRQLFFERLEQSLTLARRHEEQLALLFIDLDGFKEINDTRGHEAGDIVLRTVAQRLHEAIRESDTVARVGGDEFVILINTLHARDGLEAILHKLLDTITLPIMVQGTAHTIGASIGVSLYPDHGYDSATLLSRADSAMYVSKRSGKNRWTIYQAH